jgi:hypothetical protein
MRGAAHANSTSEGEDGDDSVPTPVPVPAPVPPVTSQLAPELILPDADDDDDGCLPADFDAAIFLSLPQNSDLIHLGEQGAAQHFLYHGRVEGRQYKVAPKEAPETDVTRMRKQTNTGQLTEFMRGRQLQQANENNEKHPDLDPLVDQVKRPLSTHVRHHPHPRSQ